MGIVFGKNGVAEPAFDILLQRNTASVPYVIRKYGERFAIETDMMGTNDNGAFGRLAGYIGVTSSPQNDGGTPISMTAPVVTESSSNLRGKAIAMTAPVITKNEDENDKSAETMQFILPAEYDSMSKIPAPTNPDVRIVEIPSAIGAVYHTNGKVDVKKGDGLAVSLVGQLSEDGLLASGEEAREKAIEGHQLWRYDPPFTIPYFRRNEVWVELDPEMVEAYLKKHSSSGEAEAK
mmetsp:Transcript_38890/g.56764  ORF Transcript_38890/g.56764 Transcript_38890/m.56764 type:complete len:235 (-) Transcript_38890:399-1103(-)